MGNPGLLHLVNPDRVSEINDLSQISGFPKSDILRKKVIWDLLSPGKGSYWALMAVSPFTGFGQIRGLDCQQLVFGGPKNGQNPDFVKMTHPSFLLKSLKIQKNVFFTFFVFFGVFPIFSIFGKFA